MNKKNLLLAIILLVFALAAYGYSFPYQAYLRRQASLTNFLASSNLAVADKITITKQGTTSTLLKESDRWRVLGPGEFYVNSELARSALATLQDLATSTLSVVSRTTSTKSSFATDSKSGTMITLWQGESKLTEFILGKSDTAYSYLSQASSDLSYATVLDLSLFASVTDWRDPVIFTSDASTWTSLKLQNNLKKSTLQLEKKGEDWLVEPAKTKLNKNKVQALVDTISALEADAIPLNQSLATGLDKPSLMISFSNSLLSNTLAVGALSNNQYYVKRSDSANIYLLNKSKIEPFFADLKALQ